MADRFEGWVAHDASGRMAWEGFQPKPWEETDVEMRVTHCGVCSTDAHVGRSELGPTTYPTVVGHEIVGVVVRVGAQAGGHIRVGDRVGVGPQSDACLCRTPPAVEHDMSGCAECAAGQENWCPRASTTYNGVFHVSRAATMGGYATFHRCPAHFVFRIPDGLASEHAAPLMCAGATVYAALRNHCCGGSDDGKAPGEARLPLRGAKVGIVGIGGLGHVAVQFARAMGADVVAAISRGRDKRADALALGATHHIATQDGDDAAAAAAAAGPLDLIVCTGTAASLDVYAGLLRRGGRLVVLGMGGGQVAVSLLPLVLRQIEITGSLISSPAETREMLAFAARHRVRPWVQLRPMSEANEALASLDRGEPRYRIVLVNGPQQQQEEYVRARL